MSTSHAQLHFVVVGAQKAGTTTLFQLLRQHGELWLPSSKEASFFSRPELYHGGSGDLMSTFFAGAPSDRLLGKVSPEYMCQPGVARRLCVAFPSVKIIAVLREPIERAYSHYRMMLRRGVEGRSFEEAIYSQLDERHLVDARRSGSGSDTYVAWGEYGRILTDYIHAFPLRNILILATSQLNTNPSMVLEQIHHFLGVSHVVPANATEHYHVGSTRQRIPHFQQFAERSQLLRRAWHLLPRHRRDLLFFRFDQWNVRRNDSNGQIPLSASEHARLSDHFRNDELLLMQSTNFGVPWAAGE